MTSEWLLMLVVGIWVAFLLPLWVRGNRSPQLQQVDTFSKAMATLRDDSLLASGRASHPSVTAKRAVRSGQAEPGRQRRLQQRRRAFLAFLSTIPLAVGLAWFALLPATVLLLPAVAFIAFVAFARYSLAQGEAARRQRIGLDPVASTRRPYPRRSLLAGLTAARRAASERLLATEREYETESTPGWQPTGETVPAVAAETWTAPEPVLPTYVNAPAATALPRQIDRDHGAWDGAAMVDAATRQRAAELQDLIAGLPTIPGAQPTPVDDNTAKLPKVAGA